MRDEVVCQCFHDVFVFPFLPGEPFRPGDPFTPAFFLKACTMVFFRALGVSLNLDLKPDRLAEESRETFVLSRSGVLSC